MMTQAAISYLLCNTVVKPKDSSSLPERDALIRLMVGSWGLSRQVVADYFDLSDRQVRRLTTPQLLTTAAEVHKPESLTFEEVEVMTKDYENDPYMSPEDREESRAYLKRLGRLKNLQRGKCPLDLF